jgi:predicted XRE-type DNA-binding protein
MDGAKHPRGTEQADSAAIRLRRELMAVITTEIRTRGWTQARAAEVARITAPRMSNLTSGKLEKFSLDALVDVAESLGIELGVQAKTRGRGPGAKAAHPFGVVT